MGRNTFEMVQSFGQWPCGSKPVFALTNRLHKLPDSAVQFVQSMACYPNKPIECFLKKGMGHIYVDGGKTIQGFFGAGFIQNIIIIRIPTLIGKGISLFGSLHQDIKLLHVKTKVFPDELEQSAYAVVT